MLAKTYFDNVKSGVFTLKRLESEIEARQYTKRDCVYVGFEDFPTDQLIETHEFLRKYGRAK